MSGLNDRSGLRRPMEEPEAEDADDAEEEEEEEEEVVVGIRTCTVLPATAPAGTATVTCCPEGAVTAMWSPGTAPSGTSTYTSSPLISGPARPAHSVVLVAFILSAKVRGASRVRDPTVMRCKCGMGKGGDWSQNPNDV